MNSEVEPLLSEIAMTPTHSGARALKTLPSTMRRAFFLLAIAWTFGLNGDYRAQAEIPEPDNVFYGIIQLGLTQVTAADTDVLVEARKGSLNGPVVASYRMGTSALAGNFYALRIPVEAFNPLTDANSSRVGALIHLSVSDTSGIRVEKTTSIAVRGNLVRVDFSQPDSDGDGLPDSWELQYFGSSSGADPNGDPDGDARNNLQEYLAGTNPLRADGRHPADHSPADNFLSSTEADAYANAWLTGEVWPVAPTNIPIAYVTRAALLAYHGGAYVFTNTPPTNGPNWWVNIPQVSGSTSARTNTIGSTAPASALPQSRITIILSPKPAAGTFAYAVEDQIPASWDVRGISHGGGFDAISHKVKWGPFLDDSGRDLTYDVVVGSTPVQTTLVGSGSFDGLNVPITGSRTLTIGTVAAAVRWTSFGNDATGVFFLLTGELRRSYVIETSSDLIQWQALQTISTDASGQYLLRPANPRTSAYRFYRARVP